MLLEDVVEGAGQLAAGCRIICGYIACCIYILGKEMAHRLFRIEFLILLVSDEVYVGTPVVIEGFI
jgi:hypothetical protein